VLVGELRQLDVARIDDDELAETLQHGLLDAGTEPGCASVVLSRRGNELRVLDVLEAVRAGAVPSALSSA
jgi:hypothetical protein